MMMQVILSEEKVKQFGFDINECYNRIDDYFISHGVKKTDQGFYKGTKKDFTTFGNAQALFTDSEWFLNVVDQWYAWYEGDTIEYREDVLASYYRVKAISDKFFKKQKSTEFRY